MPSEGNSQIYLLSFGSLMHVFIGLPFFMFGFLLLADYKGLEGAAIFGLVYAIIYIIACGIMCLGLIYKNPYLMISFSIIGYIIFAIECIFIVYWIVKPSSWRYNVERLLNNTIKLSNDGNFCSSCMFFIQTELNCCGTNSYADWVPYYPNGTVPESCCAVLYITDDDICNIENAYTEGCLHEVIPIMVVIATIFIPCIVVVLTMQLVMVTIGCSRYHIYKRKNSRIVFPT